MKTLSAKGQKLIKSISSSVQFLMWIGGSIQYMLLLLWNQPSRES